MQVLYWTAWQQSSLFSSQFTLRPSLALASDRKNEITHTSGRNEFPLQGGLAYPQRLCEGLKYVVGASDQNASWAPSFGGFSRHVQLVAGPRVDPEDAGEIIYLLHLGNVPEFPRRSVKLLLAGWSCGHSCLVYCHAPEKKGRKLMDGCETESCWLNWLKIFVALCWILQFFGCAGQFRSLTMTLKLFTECINWLLCTLSFPCLWIQTCTFYLVLKKVCCMLWLNCFPFDFLQLTP